MGKNKILLVAASLFVLVAFGPDIAQGTYVCGDANSDGSVNLGDAVYLNNHVFHNGPAPDATCCETNTVTDIDGNIYQTVTIGTQVWMAENLKVMHYRNGDPIPNVTDRTEWGVLTSGAYCEYDNSECNGFIYGKQYNWYAVDDIRGLAPEGWHVPTDEEWKQLEMYLGMSQADADDIYGRGTDEGGKLKAIGTTRWNSPNLGATNESGFSALPGGASWPDFTALGEQAHFWTSSDNAGASYWSRDLWFDYSLIGRYYRLAYVGFSVRCVRD